MSELDLVLGLLDEIQKEFKTLFQNDSTVKRIYKQIQNYAVDYDDANEFAIRVGEMLSQALQMYITVDTLPEGRFWFNMASRILEPTLTTNYNLISDVCTYAQQTINDKSRVGLKPIKPPINKDRINNFIDKVSDAEDFGSVQWMLGEPVVNYSQSVVDDSIWTNCDFQASSGLSPKIVRTLDSRETRTAVRGKQKIRYSVPCKWCQSLVGTYDYLDMPDYIYDNIFRRHENCRCKVEVVEISKNKKQDVWSKKVSDVSKQDRLRYANAKQQKTPEERLALINNKQ